MGTRVTLSLGTCSRRHSRRRSTRGVQAETRRTMMSERPVTMRRVTERRRRSARRGAHTVWPRHGRRRDPIRRAKLQRRRRDRTRRSRAWVTFTARPVTARPVTARPVTGSPRRGSSARARRTFRHATRVAGASSLRTPRAGGRDIIAVGARGALRSVRDLLSDLLSSRGAGSACCMGRRARTTRTGTTATTTTCRCWTRSRGAFGTRRARGTCASRAGFAPRCATRTDWKSIKS